MKKSIGQTTLRIFCLNLPIFKWLLFFYVFLGLMACSTDSKKNKFRVNNNSTNDKNNSENIKSKNKINQSWSSPGLRKFEVIDLDNQLKIYFIPDSSLPHLQLQLMIKAGSVNEPKGLDGLNALSAQLLERGTTKRSGSEITQIFGNMATEFSVSPSNEYSFFSADALSKDEEILIKTFAEVVSQASFRVEEIQKIKSRTLAQIQKLSEHPSEYSDQLFEQFLYGDHPYGKSLLGSKESINKITKSDLIKYYLTWFRPNNAVLAVSGRITEKTKEFIKTEYGNWAARPLPEIKIDDPLPIQKFEKKLVRKPGQTQAQIRIGKIGISRQDPNFQKARLSSMILGGDMTSRLMVRLRQQLGLTYSISAGFEVGKKQGSFEISTFTKNQTIDQTLEETLKVLKEFTEQGVTQGELDSAKIQMLANFPRALETANHFAYNLLILDFYEIGVDYLTEFQKNVSQISLSEMNKFISEQYSWDKLRVLETRP